MTHEEIERMTKRESVIRGEGVLNCRQVFKRPENRMVKLLIFCVVLRRVREVAREGRRGNNPCLPE